MCNADVSTFVGLSYFESVVDFQLSGFGILVKMELTWSWNAFSWTYSTYIYNHIMIICIFKNSINTFFSTAAKDLEFHTCCPGFALYNLFTCWRRKSDTFDIDSVTFNVIQLEITVDHGLGYAVHCCTLSACLHRFQRIPKIHSTNCKASGGGETSQTSFRTSVRCCISALFEFQSFNDFQCSTPWWCCTRVASRLGYPEFSTKPGRLIGHGPQLVSQKSRDSWHCFSIQIIQMHYSLTMHNITSFLDKRMYSNAASERSWSGACKVCASPAVMAHKPPRCGLRWKFFTSRSMTRWLDDSLFWRLALRILGWSYEYPPWHLFWQIWKRSEQKTQQKNTVRKVSKQLKIRLERSKAIWYGEALTRSRTDGWEVGGLKWLKGRS